MAPGGAGGAGGANVSQFASLYVGDLHPDVTEAMLYEIFNSVGPVGSIRVCRDSVKRKSLGYGYVNFHTVGDAERALDTLNYSSIKGRACRIMWSQRDPGLRKSGLGNIFVKNLDVNIDNKALYDTFSLFGNILSCKVSTDPAGKSFGYGFVHFETEESAKQAIERVNGMQIGDRMVEVHPFKKMDERGSDDFTNLYIKNLPDDTDDDKLKERFSGYGEIQSSRIMADKLSRKFAFVNFDTHEAAKKAIEEENGKDLRTEEQKESTKGADPESYLLYVGRAQTKTERANELRGKPGSGSQSGVNLYVKNLEDSTTDESLRELFAPFGKLLSCSAVKDDSKEKCKGFGFVCYSTPDEATKAVTEMHLKIVQGKPLYVSLAEAKDQRQEHLRQQYSKGDTGGPKGKGKGGMNMPPGGMMNNPMMGMMMKGGMQMMGKGGPMMGGPMMGKGGPMMGGPMMGFPMMGMRPGMMPPQMMGGMMKGGCMPGAMMGMRPGMPGAMMGGPRPPAGAATSGAPLTAAALAGAAPHMQKQMLGEKLFPIVSKLHPELAGKITGMMLEMDSSEVLILLESEQQLRVKVDEAVRVLRSQGA